MADFDLSGLLSQLQPLAASLGPTDDEKRTARGMAALTAAAGLLGTRKGYEAQGISQGLLGGLGAYMTDIRDIRQQRAQNLAAGAQLLNIQRQGQMFDMQKQMYNNMQQLFGGGATGAAGAAGAPAMTTGAPAMFQTQGGAAGQFDAAMAGTTPDGRMLPTQVPAPAQTPAQAPNLRDQLTSFNLMQLPITGRDLSAAIKAKYPDAIPARPGAPLLNPATGAVINANPAAPPGYYYDPQSNSFQRVSNGLEAEAASKSVGKAVDMAYTPPAERVTASGATYVPPGTKLDQLFPNGQLPYGAPSPFGASLTTPNAANGPSLTAPNAANAPAAPPAPPAAPTAFSQPNNMTKIAPADAAYQEGQGKNMAEYAKTIAEQGAAAADIKGQTQYLRNLSPYPKFGAFTPTQAKLASYALDVPFVGDSVANMILPNAQTAVPVIQDWNKQVIKLGSTATRQLGAREAAQIFEKQMAAQPNPAMTQKGANLVLDSMDGAADAALAKQQAWQQWVKANPSGTPDGFEAYWNLHYPTAGFMPGPDQIHRVLSGQDPASMSQGTIRGQGAPAAQAPAARAGATGTYNGRKVVMGGNGQWQYAQ